MSLKACLLFRLEIVGLFINTLTDDDKCSRDNKENILRPILKLLSPKDVIT